MQPPSPQPVGVEAVLGRVADLYSESLAGVVRRAAVAEATVEAQQELIADLTRQVTVLRGQLDAPEEGAGS